MSAGSQLVGKQRSCPSLRHFFAYFSSGICFGKYMYACFRMFPYSSCLTALEPVCPALYVALPILCESQGSSCSAHKNNRGSHPHPPTPAMRPSAMSTIHTVAVFLIAMHQLQNPRKRQTSNEAGGTHHMTWGTTENSIGATENSGGATENLSMDLSQEQTWTKSWTWTWIWSRSRICCRTCFGIPEQFPST